MQVILGFIRPAPTATRRPFWNLAHHNLGRVTLLAAWTVLYLGVYIAHGGYNFSYAAWLAPITVVMGGMVLLDVTLSLLRPRFADTSPDAEAPAGAALGVEEGGGHVAVIGLASVKSDGAATSATGGPARQRSSRTEVPATAVN